MGFLTRYDGELGEPLMWRQGSQVSMRMARGSVSLLSSHGRGIRPQDALKTDSPTAWQDEALARDGVSREVPRGDFFKEKYVNRGHLCRLWGIVGSCSF